MNEDTRCEAHALAAARQARRRRRRPRSRLPMASSVPSMDEVESALERIHAVLEPVLISLVAATTGLLLLGLYLPFGKFLQQILAG